MRKFHRIFKWAYEHSRFHRSIYDRASIGPEDIRPQEDIRRIPTVEKSMMQNRALIEPWKEEMI